MMPFKIINDSVVYLNETSLVDCSRVYTQQTGDSVSGIGVDAAPSFGSEFDITNEKKIVIQGEVLGLYTITGSCSSAQSDFGSATSQYTVVDKSTLNLFCTDDDIKTVEPEIMGFLPYGYSAWTREIVHANKEILDFLFNRGVLNEAGSAYVAADISNKEEVRRWATYLTLTRIFEALSNQTDDVFERKSKKYSDIAEKLSATCVLTLKKDGTNSKIEVLSTIGVIRQ